jgi:hypothetical protein
LSAGIGEYCGKVYFYITALQKRKSDPVLGTVLE